VNEDNVFIGMCVCLSTVNKSLNATDKRGVARVTWHPKCYGR